MLCDRPANLHYLKGDQCETNQFCAFSGYSEENLQKIWSFEFLWYLIKVTIVSGLVLVHHPMSLLASYEPLVSKSPYAKTLRDLRGMISSGVIVRGDLLPSERDLSERLGVARRTVRKALATLSEEGVIARQGLKARTVAAEAPKSTHGVPWVSRAVVIIVPGEESQNLTPHRGRWLRYSTLGSFDAVRSAGLHSVGLNVSALTSDLLMQLVESKPLGMLIPDVFGFMGRDEERQLMVRLGQSKVPVILYGGDPEFAAFDRVCTDHEHGSYELTKHLISLGRTRIRPCWPKPWDQYWFIARRLGYERAMIEAGLQPLTTCELPALVTAGKKNDFNADDFRRESRLCAGYLADALLGETPADALMLGTDRELSFASAGCRLLGKIPNRDVLLAGYDNYFELCEEQAFEPTIPIATVDKDNERAGSEMVKLLTARTAGLLPDEPQTRSIDQILICPQSR